MTKEFCTLTQLDRYIALKEQGCRKIATGGYAHEATWRAGRKGGLESGRIIANAVPYGTEGPWIEHGFAGGGTDHQSLAPHADLIDAVRFQVIKRKDISVCLQGETFVHKDVARGIGGEDAGLIKLKAESCGQDGEAAQPRHRTTRCRMALMSS
jgi:hypothetical protein